MRAIKIIIMVSIFCLACQTIFAQTDEDLAKAAVTSFEGGQVSFAAVTLNQADITDPVWMQENLYEIHETSTSSVEGRIWYVDASNFQVIQGVYGSNMPSETYDAPPGPFSKDDCKVEALSFVQNKLGGIDTTYVLDGDSWDGSAYWFSWRQVLNGAFTPNEIKVSVIPITKLILSFSVSHYSILPPPQVVVTPDEAIEAAKEAGEVANPDTISTPELNTDPDVLVYSISITGNNTSGKLVHYCAFINALAWPPEIVDIAISGGSEGNIPEHPKLKKASIGHIDAEGIRQMLETKGYTVIWDSKGQEVKAQKGQYRVTCKPGTKNIIINGRKVPLLLKCNVSNGRMLIPANISKAIP